MSERPLILIGPVANDPTESVSAVNRSLAAALSDRYQFVLSNADRRFGTSTQGRVNGWNLYYLIKHALIWTLNLLRHRPAIAHYAISSGAALRKGLLFLKLARLLGVKTIGHLHSGGFLSFWEKLSPERKLAALREFNKLDAFIVLSESWREAVHRKVGVPRAKLHVVNNPIDPAFEREALAFPIEREAPVILGVGILGRDKGVLDLIAACRLLQQRHPSFRLHIAGPERESGIRKAVATQVKAGALEANVHLEGSVWGQRKLELYRDAAILVLPSHYENFPLVVLEAAAAGLAIVTTPVGAVPEFFDHEKSALFVDIQQPQQLAASLDRLLSDSQLRLTLASMARKTFQARLGRTGIARDLSSVYSNCLI